MIYTQLNELDMINFKSSGPQKCFEQDIIIGKIFLKFLSWRYFNIWIKRKGNSFFFVRFKII